MERKFLMIMMISLVIIALNVYPALAMTYTYDSLGRLTSVTYDSGQTISYSYDSAGNMLSTTNTPGNKLITSYNLPTETGPAVIDSTNKTVTVTVNSGTNLTNQVATFTLSDGASAQVGSTPQVSGVTPNDLTNPVIYQIIAVDNSVQNWTVTVVSITQATQTINTVSVNPTSSTTGSAVTLTVNVSTTGVVDGTAVSAELVNASDGSSLNPAVTTNGALSLNAATLSLNVPATVAAGNYKIKVTVGFLIDSSTTYTINPSAAINTVSVSPTSSTTGSAISLTVNVSTTGVADGTTVSAELVNASDGSSLNPAVTTSGAISLNAATLSLNLPATVPAGNYKIKVTVGGGVSAMVNSSTTYTVYQSQ